MKLRLSLLAPLIATCTLGACASMHDESASKSQAAPAQMSPEEAMQKMMALATPGAPHQRFAKDVGAWTNHYKMRMDPKGPWTEFEGSSEHKLVLGGRYLIEDAHFAMEGMPMEGMQLLGYDNMSGEYISMWMDSMSTWWIESRGKEDKNGVIQMKGTMRDVAGERPFRMAVQKLGDDHVHVEMFDTIPQQGEVLVMVIDSKKKG